MLSGKRGEILEAVAYAVARVIASKHVQADPALRRLDGLGKASAVHTMAARMAPELYAEAEAAMEAVMSRLTEPVAE